MYCNPFSKTASPAVRRYTRGVAMTMAGYLLAVFGTTIYVHNHHPAGFMLYCLSALPSLCILCMLLVVVIYLRDESDEYIRMLTVRSLLAGTFVVLALSTFNDFLRSYGHSSGLPPFTEWIVFWFSFAAAQFFQRRSNDRE
jgi:hypothetical protein